MSFLSAIYQPSLFDSAKYCNKCGIPLTKDNKCKCSNNLCKECKNAIGREYKKKRMADPNDSYRRNEIKRAMEYYHNVGQKKRDKLQDKYKTPCAKCGETRMYCIVFHHIDPKTKLFNIGGADKHTEEEIKDETKKCVCLCENCHREFHHKYFRKTDDPILSLEQYLGRKFLW